MRRLPFALLLTALLIPGSASAYQTIGAVWAGAELDWSMNSSRREPMSMAVEAVCWVMLSSPVSEAFQYSVSRQSNSMNPKRSGRNARP